MPGGVRVVSVKNYEGLYAVRLPVGATYLPSVEKLPAGYEVKSPLIPTTIKGVPTTGIIGVPSLPPPAIVIGRSTRQ